MDSVTPLQVLNALDELRRDARICKARHFAAADRKLVLHRWCGVPVVLANLFVGSVLVQLQGSQPMPNTSALGLASILIAFLAASLSAIQTFFNFQKAAEGHRSVGNRYLTIMRHAKMAIQRFEDMPEDVAALWQQFDQLHEEYLLINTEAEAFPTSASDLRGALSQPELTP
ncbi:SLATT domain-containing protein [Chitinibacteraceae bacterium HSL-7]